MFGMSDIERCSRCNTKKVYCLCDADPKERARARSDASALKNTLKDEKQNLTPASNEQVIGAHNGTQEAHETSIDIASLVLGGALRAESGTDPETDGAGYLNFDVPNSIISGAPGIELLQSNRDEGSKIDMAQLVRFQRNRNEEPKLDKSLLIRRSTMQFRDNGLAYEATENFTTKVFLSILDEVTGLSTLFLVYKKWENGASSLESNPSNFTLDDNVCTTKAQENGYSCGKAQDDKTKAWIYSDCMGNSTAEDGLGHWLAVCCGWNNEDGTCTFRANSNKLSTIFRIAYCFWLVNVGFRFGAAMLSIYNVRSIKGIRLKPCTPPCWLKCFNQSVLHWLACILYILITTVEPVFGISKITGMYESAPYTRTEQEKRDKLNVGKDKVKAYKIYDEAVSRSRAAAARSAERWVNKTSNLRASVKGRIEKVCKQIEKDNTIGELHRTVIKTLRVKQGAEAAFKLEQMEFETKRALTEHELEIEKQASNQYVEVIMVIFEDLPEFCIAAVILVVNTPTIFSLNYDEIAIFFTSLGTTIFHAVFCIWVWRNHRLLMSAANLGNDKFHSDGVLLKPNKPHVGRITCCAKDTYFGRFERPVLACTNLGSYCFNSISENVCNSTCCKAPSIDIKFNCFDCSGTEMKCYKYQNDENAVDKVEPVCLGDEGYDRDRNAFDKMEPECLNDVNNFKNELKKLIEIGEKNKKDCEKTLNENMKDMNDEEKYQYRHDPEASPFNKYASTAENENDDAEANKGDHPYELTAMLCPNSNFVCNECFKTIGKGKLMYSCREHDYDSCRECRVTLYNGVTKEDADAKLKELESESTVTESTESSNTSISTRKWLALTLFGLLSYLIIDVFYESTDYYNDDYIY